MKRPVEVGRARLYPRTHGYGRRDSVITMTLDDGNTRISVDIPVHLWAELALAVEAFTKANPSRP